MAGSNTVEIRELRHDERGASLNLRHLLWPDSPRQTLAQEQEEILADPAAHGVFVAALPGGDLAGFVEVSLRDWAEGCGTRPVGYIEAWYVNPEQRRAGLGGHLMRTAERWVLSRGCTEIGSDAELQNEVSHQAHRAVGFVEVTRLVLFAKRLSP